MVENCDRYLGNYRTLKSIAMKQILLILLTCFRLISFGQPLMGILSSSQNNGTSFQNLLKYSEDCTQTAWTKSTCNATLAQGNDLDGNNTLNLIASTANYATLSQASVAVTPNTVYRFSFDAKRGTLTDMKYSVKDQTNSVNLFTSVSYYSLTNASTPVRISVEFTTPATCSLITVYMLRDLATSVQGNCYLGRVQVENKGVGYVKTLATNNP